jgi:glycosyltransferase involved in cell wall biosynthesis
MKISILLPYKENFSPNYAGAVSLFVKDINKQSKYNKDSYVFGNMDYKKKLSKNYINLKLDKKFYESSSKLYIESFLDAEKKFQSDIIEVHNRPNYIKQLKKNYNGKIILFFHNDPLTMNGSASIIDRKYLLQNIDLIIFNSNWSKGRFFIGINITTLFDSKTAICYQSAPKTKINFNKKEKIISFVGKLNKAKGYDIFGEAISKILDKYKNWKAIVIGDEPRENLTYNHKNLKIFGFQKNDLILSLLKKVSISVICSRWNEPFGRASLEAASRGSAVIISNKGGLPETSKNAIILKSLDVKTLFKNIEGLIKNKKKLTQIQKKIYSSFFLNHKYVTGIIDNIRKKVLQTNQISQISHFTTIKKLPIKILHITNFNYRFSGRLHYNTGRRINNGFIRLGHNVLSISDRDIIHTNKRITDPKGVSFLQNYILNAYNNFKPNIIILGHADNVSQNTLLMLKNEHKNLKVAQWFLDPLGTAGPDYLKNKKRILDRKEAIDASFLTSAPESLNFKIPNSYFIPNPCDQSFESLKNYNNDTINDVFFAMSHGVHRGDLKKGKKDNREIFINQLINVNKKLNFDIYGMNNVQPIWGDEFIEKISNSSMGLNLSRGMPTKYYSSDRMAQLVGNGLLTFIHKDTRYGDYFTDKQLVFYKNIEDLSYKLNKYKKDTKDRKRIAKNGRDFYFKYFNSTIVAKYILDKTFAINNKEKVLWEK